MDDLEQIIRDNARTMEDETGIWVTGQAWVAQFRAREKAERALFHLRNSERRQIASNIMAQQGCGPDQAYMMADAFLEASGEEFDASTLKAEVEKLREAVDELQNNEARLDASLRDKLFEMSRRVKVAEKELATVARRKAQGVI